MKKKSAVKDITTEILISIRDEIVGLRGEVVQLRGEFVEMKQDMNSMKKDIAFMKQDISSVKQDMKSIAAHFDRDYLFLANDVGNLKGRVEACEKALKLAS